MDISKDEATQSMEAMRVFAQANLPKLCREIREWHKTSILEDGLLREMASLCIFDRTNRLTHAERMVEHLALDFVGANAGDFDIQKLRAEKQEFREEAVRWAEEAGRLKADLRDARKQQEEMLVELAADVAVINVLRGRDERAEALLHDAQRDAERYRYLRDVAHPDSDHGISVGREVMDSWGECFTESLSGESMDVIIDAAMAAEREVSNG